MISMEQFIDKQMFIVLRDVKSLSTIGIDTEMDHMVVTLRGYEERQGIWVEISSLKNVPVTADGESAEDIPAIVFIPWYHIVSMVNFPGKNKLEPAVPRARKVGFRQE